jgi:hypothetical protein
MTAMVLTAAYISVNAEDRSNRTKKCELVVNVDPKDVSTFASAGWREYLGGMKAGTLSLGFNNDNADNDLDEDLWTLLGTVVAFEVRPSSAAVSATNPKFTGSVLITEHKPISGSVGDLNEFDVSWPTSGAVARAVA